jgi:DNA-binding protein YbaB
MNGKHRLKSLTIAPSAVDPDDIEFLQDLVLAAVNEGIAAVDALVEKEMGAVTGGLNVPGLNLPGMG